MGTTFVVEDDFHAEWMGQFPDRGSVDAFLGQLKANPSAPENQPPCMSWQTCHRVYYLLEFDDGTDPWTLLSAEPAFAVGQGEVRPITASR